MKEALSEVARPVPVRAPVMRTTLFFIGSIVLVKELLRTFEFLFEFLFRREPVVQHHSLHAAARGINGMSASADLFWSGGHFGRLYGWRALKQLGGFMF